MHLSEEQVQQLQDGELSAATTSALRTHLASCQACQELVQRIDREEQELIARIRLLDHPLPTLTAAAIARSAGGGPRRFRWAAAVLLGLGVTGVAYAVPGSPLPNLLRAAIARFHRPTSPPSAPPLPPAPPPAGEWAGLSVVPGTSLIIEFLSAPAGGQAEISLGDETEVEVRAPTGVATFSAEPGRLLVRSTVPAAQFKVRIPRTAPRVELRIAGRRLFLSEMGNVTSRAAVREADRYRLPLAAGPP